jgi:hypothetical protein
MRTITHNCLMGILSVKVKPLRGRQWRTLTPKCPTRKDLKSKDPPLKGDLLLDKRGFYILLFYVFFFLKVPFFPDDRKYMCFLGFSYHRKNIFFYCAFYFPIIRLSFPIDRKENESQDVITEKQRDQESRSSTSGRKTR